MNIAIAAPSPIPFQVGGAEKLFWGLTSQISSLTRHNAELIKVPCLDRKFWSLLEGYKVFSQLDLSHFDMVISTKYPAWAVQHPNHYLYLQHTSRGLYDLYARKNKPLEYPMDHPALKPLDRILRSTPSRSRMPELFQELFRLRRMNLGKKRFAFPGPLTRAVIHWLDKACMAPDQIQSHNAISANVARREDYFPPGVQVRVIHHPSDNSESLSGPGEYIFTASRLENLKRLDLLLQAFAQVDTNLKFYIAGTGGKEKKLRQLAENDPRVVFLGYIQEQELLEHYAKALFVPFVPYDEDYGLITVEAMASGKPVLTCSDSGGVHELVRHRENGLVAEPEPESLARAMQELISNPEMTRQMGENARESVADITWENTIQALLGEQKPWTTVAVPRRKKLVVASTFQVTPADSGGKQRIFYLCRELARHADVTLVTLGTAKTSGKPVPLSQGVTEISIPRSKEHRAMDRDLKHKLGASAQDIAAIHGFEATLRFMEVLGRECRDADLALLAHPFLYFALRQVYSGPFVYDAHNVEYDM
ncbi:MAG: glycosyltransferase family 4 protein, partial [Desulfohalobiaceae bacterium]